MQMVKRIDNNTRVSIELKVQDWKNERLNFIEDILKNGHSQKLWEKAYAYFYQRVESRFLKPIQWILDKGKDKGEGFSAVALQCILIEFLESFYQGKIYTPSSDPNHFEYNKSERLFIDFLMNHHPFSNYFQKKKSARGFYSNIRCGLLHEAATKETSRIKSGFHSNDIIDFIENYDTNMFVYKDNFFKAIIDYLRSYKEELFKNKSLKINFVRKFDDICGIKRVMYFAYGSNLFKEQLFYRIKKYHTAQTAILKDFKFSYNKKGKDGTAKANIVKSENSKVYGVIYEIDEDDFKKLNNVYEKGYDQLNITVNCNGALNAITFKSDSIINNIGPSEEYRLVIRKGAKEWNLDGGYIENNL